MQRTKPKGKIMHYPITSRQSAQDYEAALLLSGQLALKAWKRFGAQVFASLAAFTLTFVTIGGAIVAPLDHTAAATKHADPMEQFVRGHTLLA